MFIPRVQIVSDRTREDGVSEVIGARSRILRLYAGDSYALFACMRVHYGSLSRREESADIESLGGPNVKCVL